MSRPGSRMATDLPSEEFDPDSGMPDPDDDGIAYGNLPDAGYAPDQDWRVSQLQHLNNQYGEFGEQYGEFGAQDQEATDG